MKLNELKNFVLIVVLVGMILGVGILVLDSFSSAAYINTGVINGSFTYPAVNGSVSLGRELLTLTGIVNSTAQTVPTTAYNVTLSTGVISSLSNGSCDAGDTCFASYTYKRFGVATTSINASRDSLSPIATTWMPLIVTVAILSIILVLVIKSFSMGLRRQ